MKLEVAQNANVEIRQVANKLNKKLAELTDEETLLIKQQLQEVEFEFDWVEGLPFADDFDSRIHMAVIPANPQAWPTQLTRNVDGQEVPLVKFSLITESEAVEWDSRYASMLLTEDEKAFFESKAGAVVAVIGKFEVNESNGKKYLNVKAVRGVIFYTE